MTDILLPPISLLPFINKQLDEKFAVLRAGPNYNETAIFGYNTLEQAIADGAVVLAYGNFIDKLINFAGIGFTLYTIAQLYGWASSDPIIHETTKCKYCRKWISVKVGFPSFCFRDAAVRADKMLIVCRLSAVSIAQVGRMVRIRGR